jgi:hypothetical protein
VGKALAKRPEARYQQAADLATALRSRGVGGSPLAAAGPAVAVTGGRPASSEARSRQAEGMAAPMPAPGPASAVPPTAGRLQGAVTPLRGIPAGEAPKKRGKAVPILIAAIALLVIALAAGGVYLALSGKGGTGEKAAGVITVVVVPGETSTVLPAEELPSQTPVIIVVISTPQPGTTPEPAATDTPAPIATNTPEPAPTAKPTATPTKKPAATKPPASLQPPVLVAPAEGFNCYNQREQGCDFNWSWSGRLAANQYFQVQLVGPGNEHRGIHPPTKGYSFHSSNDVFLIITDWCNKDYYCHIKWTVAIIEWDGKDPSKIGRTLKEATPRTITL